MIEQIYKRDGRLVDFDADKLNKWSQWASELTDVSWSDVSIKAYRKCTDKCTTVDLHQALIDACVEKADYKHFSMAGRLLIGDLYKTVFGGIENIPSLKAFYNSMVKKDLWTEMSYTPEEFKQLDAVLNHSKDLYLSYTEAKQLKDKYIITDRTTKTPFETPQFMYMGIAMANMERQPTDRRLTDVINLYKFLSDKKINFPTPFLTNLRTKHRGYASCCVYSAGDSIQSLAAGDHIAYIMTAASAGIGAHLQTRSKHDKVRSGTIEHMGKVGYYRNIESAVAANMQNNRGGAATIYFTCLDPEFKDLILLKSVTTPTQKQVRGVDYSVGTNKRFAEAVAKGEQWMLISYGDAPDLYEALYKKDDTEFRELYDKYKSDPSIKKQFVSAREIILMATTQGAETGRIYLHQPDEMNRHTPFKEPIYMSNLCAEISIISKAYDSIQDLYKEQETSGEIGLCSLSALVPTNIEDDKDYEKVAYYAVLAIDNVMSLMDYPFPNLKYTATRRRSIGVGLTDLAHLMAIKGLRYTTQEGKNFIHRTMERHSYFLHKASLRLAKEIGVCEWMDRTLYPDGWLPIDTYNKNVDSVVTTGLHYDWEELRRDIIANGGIRNSVLEAFMPNESSSLATNSTNSIYPIRALKVVKTNGKTKNVFLAPDADELADQYDIAWDIPTKDIIDLYAITQKFTGQGISADEYLDYSKYPNNKITDRVMLTNYLYIMKMGLKSRYYVNTRSGVVDTKEPEQIEDKGCASGACAL
jgi:ribonucleoside-diphosphate reductase alpha chain